MIRRGAGIALILASLGSLLPVLALDAEETAFLSIINDYRASYGLSSLSLSPTLTLASELHSQDMADQDYFSHYSLDGRSPLDRVNDAGYNYATTVGENIAAGYVTAASVFEGWRNSSSHNSTMLYPSFTAIGIGRAYNASSYYGWYWTTDFGGYDDSGEPPPPPPPTVQVSSPTHPEQDIWFSNDDPSFLWDPVPDADGYSYLLDQISSTTPDTTIDSTTTGQTYTDLADGIWHFHIRVKTPGGWGDATHYRVKVDCTAPSSPSITSSTHPDQDTDYPDDDPSFSWSTPSDTSGISGYSCLLDQNPLTTPDQVENTSANQRSYQDVGEGTWYFHVRAIDSADNWGPASHFRIKVRFIPIADFVGTPTTGFEPLSVNFTDLSFSQTGIVNWSWGFGDGSSSNDANPTHIYEEEGNFTVTLIVTESDGDTDSETKTHYISVSTAVPDQDLIDSISADWPCVIGASVFGAYVDADSFVDPFFPGANHCHDQVLLVESTGSAAYLGINLSPIPSQATIISATLGVYLEFANDLDEACISVQYCLGDTWSETEICWANRPTTCGTECDLKHVGYSTQSYLRFNVTLAISESLSQRYATILLALSSGNGSLTFSSREGSQRPILAVQYAVNDVFGVDLASAEDTGLVPDLGVIVIQGSVHQLPTSISIVEGSYTIDYLAGYEFNRWETQGGISVGNPTARSTSLSVSGPGSLVAMGSIKNMTYSYDDGSCEYSLGRSKGHMVAVSFSPIFVGNLTHIQFYVGEVSQHANNTALIHILDKDRQDLIPPILFTPESEGWLRIEVCQQVTMVDEFLIAIEYLNNLHPRIGSDTDGSGSSLTWKGSYWLDYHSNYMIRSEVENMWPLRRITCLSLDTDTIYPSVGQPIVINGSLEPGLSGIPITISIESPGLMRFNETILTGSSGGFLLEYTAMEAGNWSFIAAWTGSDGYQGTISDLLEFHVEKGSIHIGCSVDPLCSHSGETIRISGVVTPVILPVTLYYKLNGDEWDFLVELDCQLNRGYEYFWIPPQAGGYEFRAMWSGDDNFESYSSYPFPHNVLQGYSEMTISLNQTLTRFGSSVLIEGSISPPSSAAVEIEYWREMNWNDLAIVQSREDGFYLYVWEIDFVGSAILRSSWTGNANYDGAISESICLKAEKATSNIFCIADPTSAEPNQSVTIQGRVCPPLEVPITLNVSRPEGNEMQLFSVTNGTGDYLLNLGIDETGEWRIIAWWQGNEEYEGCWAPRVSIMVDYPVDDPWQASLVLLPFSTLFVAGFDLRRRSRAGG